MPHFSLYLSPASLRRPPRPKLVGPASFARLRSSTHTPGSQVPEGVTTTRGDSAAPATNGTAYSNTASRSRTRRRVPRVADPPPAGYGYGYGYDQRGDADDTRYVRVPPRLPVVVCATSTSALTTPALYMALALAPFIYASANHYAHPNCLRALCVIWCIGDGNIANTPASDTNPNTSGHGCFRPPSVVALDPPTLVAAALRRKGTTHNITAPDSNNGQRSHLHPRSSAIVGTGGNRTSHPTWRMRTT